MIKIGSVVKIVEPLYGFSLLTNYTGVVEHIYLSEMICNVRFFNSYYCNDHFTLAIFTKNLEEIL